MKRLRAQTLSEENNRTCHGTRTAPGSTTVQSCYAASERVGGPLFCTLCEDDVGSGYVRSVFAQSTYSSQALPILTRHRYFLGDRQ